MRLYVNQGKNDLRVVDSTEYDDDNDEMGEQENGVTKEENHGSSDSDIDSDEERRRFFLPLLNSVNFQDEAMILCFLLLCDA